MILSANPQATYLAAKIQIDDAIQRVLASGNYINGAELMAFEREFANWIGNVEVVGVGNGTDALELALRALELKPNAQVATVANTVSATVAAIVAAGARPLFVDIDPATMLMAPHALEKALRDNPNIGAVLPVHLYGHACDMPAIVRIAESYNLPVIEDCAQAHGAVVAGRVAGTWGAAAAFSFYPTKNLGALGDAGAVVTKEPALAERVRQLRQYGWKTRYVSEIHGRNSRLDELQAAVLRAKLARLTDENLRRQKIASYYLDELKGIDVRLPTTSSGCTHVWHQFVVRSSRRDALKSHLESNSIMPAVLYPVPIHHQSAYTQTGQPSLVHTERACNEVLSLPVHTGLTDDDAKYIVDVIRKWQK